MKILDAMQNKLDLYFDRINDQLEKVSPRERVLVILTSIFLIVAIVGSALWYMHIAAEKQQKRVNELKDLVAWMQVNVVSMKTADDLALTTAEKIQRIAQKQGLSVVSQQQGEQLQLVVQHENYAILANFLTQIAQMGVSIEKMEFTKVDGQIKLTATVQ